MHEYSVPEMIILFITAATPFYMLGGSITAYRFTGIAGVGLVIMSTPFVWLFTNLSLLFTYAYVNAY